MKKLMIRPDIEKFLEICKKKTAPYLMDILGEDKEFIKAASIYAEDIARGYLVLEKALKMAVYDIIKTGKETGDIILINEQDYIEQAAKELEGEK